MRTLRAKILILATLLFSIATLASTLVVYKQFRDSQAEAFDASLYNHAVDIANNLQQTSVFSSMFEINVARPARKLLPFSVKDSIIQIRNLNGELIAASREHSNTDLPLTTLSELKIQGRSYSMAEVDDRRYRVLNYLFSVSPAAPLIMQIAAPVDQLRRAQQGVLTLIFTVAPILLLFAWAFAYVISNRALSPLFQIIAQAQKISASDLSNRVSVPRENELRTLANTINDLLQRLEKSFSAQEQFIANSAHQLKTPLSIVKGEIEVLLRQPRNLEEIRPVLTSISEEVDALSRLVGNLLLLAQFDSGIHMHKRTEVRLDEILLNSSSRLKKSAAGNNIKVSIKIEEKGESPVVAGDIELIEAMFFNLMENAIKYATKGSTVWVLVYEGANGPAVEITNYGLAIDPSEQSQIFERFRRGAKTSAGGFGLGLAIAEQIAQAHGASIRLKTLDSRTSFTVSFSNQPSTLKTFNSQLSPRS